MELFARHSALARLVAPALFPGLASMGCVGNRVVRFEEPRGALVRFEDLEKEEPREIPFERELDAETGYLVEVVFPDPVLRVILGPAALGTRTGEEAKLRGVLVCPHGGEEPAAFRLPPDGILAALRDGSAAYARDWDAEGRFVLLFKGSVSGVGPADPEIAPHVGRTARKTGETILGVGTATFVVAVIAVAVGAVVVALALREFLEGFK